MALQLGQHVPNSTKLEPTDEEHIVPAFASGMHVPVASHQPQRLSPADLVVHSPQVRNVAQ